MILVTLYRSSNESFSFIFSTSNLAKIKNNTFILAEELFLNSIKQKKIRSNLILLYAA